MESEQELKWAEGRLPIGTMVKVTPYSNRHGVATPPYTAKIVKNYQAYPSSDQASSVNGNLLKGWYVVEDSAGKRYEALVAICEVVEEEQR